MIAGLLTGVILGAVLVLALAAPVLAGCLLLTASIVGSAWVEW
jgi:hypothetical protein